MYSYVFVSSNNLNNKKNYMKLNKNAMLLNQIMSSCLLVVHTGGLANIGDWAGTTFTSRIVPKYNFIRIKTILLICNVK